MKIALAGRNTAFRAGGIVATSAARARLDWRVICVGLIAMLAAANVSAAPAELRLAAGAPRFGSVLFGSSLNVTAVAIAYTPDRVEFYLDSKLIKTDTTAPYTIAVTGLKPGRHTLFVFGAGNPDSTYASTEFEVVPPVGTPVIADDFVDGYSGWAYQDDTFRGTHQPAYAKGAFGATERHPAMPRIELGGVDEKDIHDISGAFVTTFVLNSAAEAELRFAYVVERGEQEGVFEPDEFLDVMVAVDGVLRGFNGASYVARVTAVSGGGRVTIPLGRLAAGAHRIVIGGYANKKTEPWETEFVGIDWVLVETIPAPNALPVVKFTSPASGTHVVVDDGMVNFTVAASDPGGSIVRVEFYLDAAADAPMAIDEEAPYAASIAYPRGVYTAKVVTTDNSGAQSTALLPITVGNPAPHVEVTFPADRFLFVHPGDVIPVKVAATDVDGGVQRVEVVLSGYTSTVFVGTDTTAPYQVNVPTAGLPDGYYVTTAIAYDTHGAWTFDSGAVQVMVAQNLPPVVAITTTNLQNGQVVPPGTTLHLKVKASDPDGSVSKVELRFADRVLTDTTAPFDFTVDGLPRGPNGVEAIAYDNLGKRSEGVVAFVRFDVGAQVTAMNGDVSPSDFLNTLYFAPGDHVTVTANPAPAGWIFDQWTGDVTDLDNPFKPMARVNVPANHHVSVQATYKPITDPTLVKLVLINADTDQPIARYDPLYNGAVLKLSSLPTRRLNIRAVTRSEPTGSVLFAWDAALTGGIMKTEKEAPYALGGDNKGNYEGATPSVGAHTLTTWAFKGANRTGARSTPLTINVQVE